MPDKNTNNKAEEKQAEKNVTFEVPLEGSLGLLALGAVGLKAWRKKREEEKAKENKNRKER